VVVITVWPRARRRFGWPVLAVTAGAAVSIPIATSAGEALEHALPRTAALETHTRLGDQLLPFVIPFLVLTAALVLLDWYVHSPRSHTGRLPTIDPRSAPGTAASRPPSTTSRDSSAGCACRSRLHGKDSGGTARANPLPVLWEFPGW